MIRPIGRLGPAKLVQLRRAGSKLGPSQPSTLPPAFASLTLRPRSCRPSSAFRLLNTSTCSSGGLGSGRHPRKPRAVTVAEEDEADLAADETKTVPQVVEEEVNADEAADDVLPGASSFRLRPYQLDCVEAVLEALKDGYTRIGVSAPTGKLIMTTTFSKTDSDHPANLLDGSARHGTFR